MSEERSTCRSLNHWKRQHENRTAGLWIGRTGRRDGDPGEGTRCYDHRDGRLEECGDGPGRDRYPRDAGEEARYRPLRRPGADRSRRGEPGGVRRARRGDTDQRADRRAGARPISGPRSNGDGMWSPPTKDRSPWHSAELKADGHRRPGSSSGTRPPSGVRSRSSTPWSTGSAATRF